MTGLEIVTTVEVDDDEFVVYGSYSHETPKGEFDFFDVYVSNGDSGLHELVDLGEPFRVCPSADEILEIAQMLRAAREVPTLDRRRFRAG